MTVAATMENEALLSALNDVQREAVETLDGPVLVLAGAGTGKTRVLTVRLAHLLHQRRAQPWQTLAVTFTNRAARQMRDRVTDMVGPAAEAAWLGTFHALGARLLRRHAELAALRSDFTILDADDQVRLLKQLLEARNIDAKKWPARMLMGVIQRWKDRGLTPDKVGEGEAGDLAGGHLLDLYREYQDRLSTLNAADFGDLLLHPLEILTTQSDILADYQEQFHYILVDEYQDTNVAQYLLLRLLAQGRQNIACVGDDDQSIYSWRGAEVGNILRFEQDFPGATVIRLEQNYRSTEHILGAAAQLIAHNDGRLGKTLWTAKDGGEKVIVRGVWDGEEEARVVADEIEASQRAKIALNNMAVLVRAGFQTREFEDRFLTLGIPYRVVGGPRFYERQEIRDALAYLRVIHQPDDDLAFERIVNKPKRGLGEASVQTLHLAARAGRTSLFRAAGQIIETDELRPQAVKSLAALMQDFTRWRVRAGLPSIALHGSGNVSGLPTDGQIGHTELAEMVLDESGYTEMLMTDRSPEAPGRLENLKELIVAMGEFDNLAGFLEHISLVMENAGDNAADQVNIMTLHSAKGLEFDTVFLPGWEEDIFPNRRSLDETGDAGLEEERRLAYVGLTRAKRRAMILFAANRLMFGQWQSALPSRFIDELAQDHIEMESEVGLYGGGEARLTQRGRGHDRHGRAARRAPRSRGLVRYEIDEHSDLGAGSSPEDSFDIYDEDDSPDRIIGERVFHNKFGFGKVIAVDGGKLEIAFDKAGTKKVMASFVEATRSR